MPTATILTRTAKGSALTQAEMDTNLTNLKAAVEDAANETHTHEIADVNGLQDALDDKIAEGDSRLTDSRTPVSHTHVPSAIVGMAMYVAARGVATLVAGEIAVTNAAWSQSGGQNCILLLTYERVDSLVNPGYLYPKSTTGANNEFIIKSSNAADTNAVNWVILKQV